MDYTIKAKETIFKEVLFRSRLEAKWAAMFELCGWAWQYEPVDLPRWSPDFFIHIRRPRANGLIREIKLLAEVKPYTSIDQFDGHPCELNLYGHEHFECEACVGLGINPSVCLMHLESDSEGSHGQCDFDYLVSCSLDFDMSHVMALWAEACNATRWAFDSQGKRYR